MEHVLNEFLKMHDECLMAWEESLKTGNISKLEEYPSESYFGLFGYADLDGVILPTDVTEATNGLRQLVNALKGSQHVCSNRIVRSRNENEVVVSYERMIERQGQRSIKFLVIQTWKNISGKWRLSRELVENVKRHRCSHSFRRIFN